MFEKTHHINYLLGAENIAFKQRPFALLKQLAFWKK